MHRELPEAERLLLTGLRLFGFEKAPAAALCAALTTGDKREKLMQWMVSNMDAPKEKLTRVSIEIAKS